MGMAKRDSSSKEKEAIVQCLHIALLYEQSESESCAASEDSLYSTCTTSAPGAQFSTYPMRVQHSRYCLSIEAQILVLSRVILQCCQRVGSFSS